MNGKDYYLRLLALIVLLVLSGAACRRGTANEDVGDNAEQTAAVTTLRFADAAFKEQLYGPLMGAFAEENPGWQVEYVPVEEAAIRQDGQIDLFRLASLADTMVLPRPAGATEAGYFVDLNTWPEASRPVADDYWPGALAACTAGDVQVAFPLHVVPTTFYAHGDVLEAAGQALPPLDWSWEQFAALVQAVSESDPERYGFVQREGLAELFGPTIDSLLPAGSTRPDAAALAAATDWYGALVRAGHVALPADETDPEALISDGQAAFWIESPAQLGGRRNALGDDVVLLPYPQGTAGENSTPLTPACAAISAGTRHAEAAQAWLEFLAQRPFTGRRAEIPGRIAIADSSGFWGGLDEDTAGTYRYVLEHGWYGNVTPAIEAVAAALSEALAGEAGAEDALAAIEELPTATPAPTPAGPPVVVEVEESAEAAGTLAFYTGNSALISTSAMQASAERFRVQTGITVAFHDFSSMIGFAGGGTFNVFEELVTNNDCFLWESGFPDTMLEQLVPLEELLATEYPELLADYDPLTLQVARQPGGGTLRGLPVVLNPQAVYYHATRFERREVPVLQPGWTLEELLAVAGEMPLGEGRSQIYGYVPYDWFSTGPYELLFSFYGLLPYDLAADPPVLNLDDPQLAAAVEEVAALVGSGVIAPYDAGGTRNSNNSHVMNEIINEGRATIWNESIVQAAGRLHDRSRNNFTIGLVSPPLSDVPLPAPAATQLYISGASENVAGCLAWVEHISGEPEVWNGVPARLSVLNSPEWEEHVGAETAAIYRDILARSTRLPPSPILVGPVQAWFMDAIAAVFEGGDAVQELEAAQETAEDYLACMAGITPVTFEAATACAVEADPDYPQPEE